MNEQEQLKKIKSDLRVLNIPVTANTGKKLVNMISEYGIDVIADYITKTTPHLIRSQQIKREAVEGFAKYIKEDADKIQREAQEKYPESFNVTGTFYLDASRADKYIKKLAESYLTQSKEGGE